MRWSRVRADKVSALDEGSVITVVDRTRIKGEWGSWGDGLDQAAVVGIPTTGFLIGRLSSGLFEDGCEIEPVVEKNFKPEYAKAPRILERIL